LSTKHAAEKKQNDSRVGANYSEGYYYNNDRVAVGLQYGTVNQVIEQRTKKTFETIARTCSYVYIQTLPSYAPRRSRPYNGVV